jgi:hypothetical protein
MNGAGIDMHLSEWFETKVPITSIPPNYIYKCLTEKDTTPIRENATVVWLGGMPDFEFFEAKKGKETVHMCALEFYDKQKDWQLVLKAEEADWIMANMPKLMIGAHALLQYGEWKKSYEAMGLKDFDTFMQTKAMKLLRENGLLIL